MRDLLFEGVTSKLHLNHDFQIKKIALIGPESAGKTTLCELLSKHFHTVWVPEMSRHYIGELCRKYTLEDIEHATKLQLNEEETLIKKAHRFLFCDSDMIIAKVWCEDVFKTVPAWIEEKVNMNLYDLHLLTLPDIPFVQDPVRENPHRRDFFFDWYKKELEERKSLYEIIGGQGDERLKNAIAAISKHFPYKKT